MSNENKKRDDGFEKESLLAIMEETEKLAGVGGWEWDIDTDIWTFSDNWLRIHGCSGSHLKTADLLPIAHPDDRSDIELAFGRAVIEGANYEIEHRIIRQDTGEERYIRSFGKPRLDSDGKVVKLLGSAQDITKQKKVEETLRESERKFRTLAENVPGLVLRYKLDPNGNDELLYISKSVEDIFEVSQEDAYNNNKLLWDRIHRDDLEGYMKSIRTSAENLSLWQQEHRIQLPGDRVKWLYTRGTPFQQDDGAVIWNTIALDITEQKKAQALLEEKDKALRLSLDAAKAGTWTWDAKTDEVVWDEQMQKIFGLEPGTFTGTFDAWKERVHPDDLQEAEDATLEALERGKRYEHEYRVKGFSGDWRIINAHAATLKDKNGEPIRMSGFAIDITDRKEMEEALKRSQQRFELAMTASRDGIYDWDLVSNKIYYSPGWKSMLGYGNDELPNDFSVWEKLTEQVDVKRSWEMQQELINKVRDRFEMEFRMKHKDGHWVDILSRATAIFDHNGKAVRIVGTHVDVTERRQIEKRIRKREKLYRTILQTAIDGFWITDVNGYFLEVNSAYSKMSGYSHNELLTMKIADIEINEDQREIEEHLKRGITKGYGHFQSLHRRKDNSTYPVEVNFAYLDREGGKFIVFIKDITERKEAENRLLKNQYYLTKAQEIGKIGTWELDIQKNILIWTDENYKTFGVPLGTKLNYEIFLSCIYPEDREYVNKKWNEALTTKSYDIMHRVVVENKIKWVREKADFELDSEGNPAIAVGFTQDLTDLKQVESALRESEKKFKDMFERAPLSYQSLDENGNFIEVNQTWLKTMGYTRGEVLGENFGDFLVPEWKDHFKENFPRFKAIGEILDVEFEMVKKDGSTILVSFHGKIGKNEKGDFKQTHCIFRDISDIRQAEEKSNRLKERLESLWNIAKISDSDIKTISDHVLVEVQKMTQSQYAFYGFLDKNDSDMILHAWSQETMEDCRIQTNTLHFPIDKAGIWAEAVKEKKILTINDLSSDLPNKKGVPVGHVQLTRLMVVPYIKEGKVISIVAVANKETEYLKDDEEQVLAFMRNVQLLIDRKTAQQEAAEMAIHLQQAQKMEAIGTLAGGIAHDFNNILGSILGYAEMVQEDCPPGSTMRSDMDRVVEASLRAKELVRQILAFSHQTETEEVPLQPALIIKEAVKMLRSSLPTTIDLQQNIDPEAGLTLADPTQIHQIITNLCTNAFHSMEKTGGTLNISLKNKSFTLSELVHAPYVKPGTFVEISVGDTGPGIEPEIMHKIFDPFFTTKGIGKGTGMGLAIIHGIAKKSGGFISCKSSPGEGTTFYVYLPIYAGMAPPVAEMTPLELIKPGNERILFIDDEEMLAEMGKTMLERLGYRVTVETSSIQALTIVQNQPDRFDLIITDQTMPGMTGSDLARRILQLRPGLPIILCTGFSNLISEEKARIYGIKGFAMKPLAKKDLADLIRKVLDEET